MKYEELVEKAATLPRMDRDSVPYLVTRVFGGDPNTSLLTLIAHRDGTYSAAHGDLRTKAVPMTDADGRELRFPDEDSACDWAWGYLQEARGRIPTYDAEQRARDEAAGAEVRRRWDEFVRSQAEPHDRGGA
ncbi:hypothetical protein [Leifsonia aquatica]|uniref:hypothetical protein n=1 Tax=Leifsonia aquatica TaxID=144185 RepID=UPI0013B35F4C|nr:hypothetical protein [Leifsonia aquatica]